MRLMVISVRVAISVLDREEIGFLKPVVSGPGEQPIDQGNEQRGERERPEEPVRPEELELHDPRADGHQRGKEEAARPRVGRRPRVGDHEEGKEHEGAALEPMQGDAHRLSEPERPSDEERAVAGEKGERPVAPRGPVDDETAGGGEEEAEHRRAAPLARRDPDLSRRDHHCHQREVRRIEDVLVPDPQDELARDGDDGSDRRESPRIRAKQETQRKSRDQRATWIEA